MYIMVRDYCNITGGIESDGYATESEMKYVVLLYFTRSVCVLRLQGFVRRGQILMNIPFH